MGISSSQKSKSRSECNGRDMPGLWASETRKNQETEFARPYKVAIQNIRPQRRSFHLPFLTSRPRTLFTFRPLTPVCLPLVVFSFCC